MKGASTLGTCVSILAPFAIIFTRTSLFFHLLMFQGHESLADHLWRSLSHLSYKVVSLFLDLQMVVSDFSSDLDLFCHVIQSQAALACASCARSLGSGNRCPGVLWSGVLVLLLPSFSSLSSMARKLINFQSCTILLVAFLGKCQVFGLEISFKKAIGSSSYSSITISSGVLLLIFMEFLSSSFLAEVSFKKNFHRRGLGGFLSSITVYDAMWNCFKNL